MTCVYLKCRMKKSYLTFDLDFIMFLVVSPIFRLENATAKNEEPLMFEVTARGGAFKTIN